MGKYPLDKDESAAVFNFNLLTAVDVVDPLKSHNIRGSSYPLTRVILDDQNNQTNAKSRQLAKEPSEESTQAIKSFEGYMSILQQFKPSQTTQVDITGLAKQPSVAEEARQPRVSVQARKPRVSVQARQPSVSVQARQPRVSVQARMSGQARQSRMSGQARQSRMSKQARVSKRKRQLIAAKLGDTIGLSELARQPGESGMARWFMGLGHSRQSEIVAAVSKPELPIKMIRSRDMIGAAVFNFNLLTAVDVVDPLKSHNIRGSSYPLTRVILDDQNNQTNAKSRQLAKEPSEESTQAIKSFEGYMSILQQFKPSQTTQVDITGLAKQPSVAEEARQPRVSVQARKPRVSVQARQPSVSVQARQPRVSVQARMSGQARQSRMSGQARQSRMSKQARVSKRKRQLIAAKLGDTIGLSELARQPGESGMARWFMGLGHSRQSEIVAAVSKPELPIKMIRSRDMIGAAVFNFNLLTAVDVVDPLKSHNIRGSSYPLTRVILESQPTDLKIVEDLPLHIGLSADVEEHVYATITHSLQTENSPLLDLSSRCNKKTASFNLSSTKLKSDNKPCVTSTVQRSPVSSLLFSMKQNHSVIS